MPASIYNTQPTPGNLKVGKGVIASIALSLAALGSVFATNYVGRTNNVSLVAVNRAIVTPAYAPSTGSGGSANDDAILLSSPFAAGSTDNGLRTGTGVAWLAQLDIIADPNGNGLDCSVVSGARQATGGTLIFNNVSGTGTVATTSTSFVLGPTQKVKCATLKSPTSSFSASLRLIMSDTDVIN